MKEKNKILEKFGLYDFLKWRRWLSLILVFTLIIGDCNPLLAAVVTKEKKVSIKAMIAALPQQESGVKKLSDSSYLLTNRAEIALEVKVVVNDLEQNGKIKGLYAGLQLGYIADNVEGGLTNTDQKLGKIQARVTNDGNSWKDRELVGNEEKYTDPDRIYNDELCLHFVADDFLYQHTGNVYTYNVKVGFDGQTKKNVVIDLKSFVGYEGYYVGNELIDSNYDSKKESDNSKIQLANSNLEWKTTVTALSGAKDDSNAPTIWKKYNYQDIIGEMKNTSKAKDSVMDAFEFVFFIDTHYVKEKDIIAWRYNKSDPNNPVQNTATTVEEDQRYIGKYNQGGILIYDITDLSEKQIAMRRNLGKPLPYSYAGNGTFTVHVNKEQGGTLVSEEKAQEDIELGAKSARRLLIRLPVRNGNYFAGDEYSLSLSTRMFGNAIFGNPSVKVADDTTKYLEQYFQRPREFASLEKTAQEEPMYIGKEAYYSLDKITNNGNYPACDLTLEDQLPEHFDFTKLSYVITKEEQEEWMTWKESNKFDITTLFQKDKPVELGFYNAQKEVVWIPVTQGWEVKDETTFELKKLDQLIEQQIQQQKDYTFARKIKVNYTFTFDKDSEDQFDVNCLERGEMVKGSLRVWGIPRKAITLQNNAQIHLNYWKYYEPSDEDKQSGAQAEWKQLKKGPYKTNAGADVVAPELWSDTKAFYKDKEDTTVTGVVNKDVGYRVRFGINNESELYNGQLILDLPYLKEIPLAYYGFHTKQLKIKKAVLDKGMIDTVKVEYYGGESKTFSLSELSKDGEDYVLKQEQWKEQLPIRVTIAFKTVKSNTKALEEPIKNDQAYIEMLGSYPFPEDAILHTTFQSNYHDNLQKEVSTESKATLQFAKPDLQVLVNAFSHGNKREEEKTVKGVKYEDQVGYTYRIGSNNEVKIAPGHLTIDLPMISEEEKKELGIVAGSSTTIPSDKLNNPRYLASEITITKEMLRKMKLSNIEIIPAKGEKTTISAEQLGVTWQEGTGSVCTDGDLTINKSQWKGNARYITIYFDSYEENTPVSTDVTSDKTYVQVRGAGQREGTYISKGTVYTDYPIHNISKEDDATLEFPTPTLSAKMTAIFDNGKPEEKKEIDGEITEKTPLETIKNKPYSGYRFYVKTQDVGLAPGEIDVSVPFEFETDTITLNQGLLASLCDSKGIPSYETLTIEGTLGTNVSLSKQQLETYRKEKTDLVLTKEQWGANFQEGERIQSVKLSFRLLNRTEQTDATQFSDYIELFGKVIGVGSRFEATGIFGFPKEDIHPDLSVTKKAAFSTLSAKPWIQVYATKKIPSVMEEDKTTSVEGKELQGEKGLEEVGFTYRIGSESGDRLEPGYLSIALPSDIGYDSVKKPGFHATSIQITKEMLSEMKLNHIVVESNTGKKTTITLNDLEITWKSEEGTDYMKFTKDIVIPETMWEGIARHVYVYFDYYSVKKQEVLSESEQKEPFIPSSKLNNAYVKVLGYGEKEGTFTTTGVVSTAYLTGLGYNSSQSGNASLKFVYPTLACDMVAFYHKNEKKEGKTVEAYLKDPEAGYRFSVAAKDYALLPGKIHMLLGKKTGSGTSATYDNIFRTDQITVSKTLVDRLLDRENKPSYTHLLLIGNKGSQVTITKEQLEQQKTGQGIVIPSSVWIGKEGWQEEEKVSEITLYFSTLRKGDMEGSFVEVKGAMLHYTGKYNQAKGTLGFQQEEGYDTKQDVTSDAYLYARYADVWLITKAFEDKDNTTREEGKALKGTEEKGLEQGKNQVGYVYRFGSKNDIPLQKGTIRMFLPQNSEEEKKLKKDKPGISLPQEYGFVGKQLLIKKELLAQLQVEQIVVTSDKEEKTYTFGENGLTLDKTKDYILSLKEIKGTVRIVDIQFRDYGVKQENETDEAYVEIKGSGTREGTYVSECRVYDRYYYGSQERAKDDASLLFAGLILKAQMTASKEKVQVNEPVPFTFTVGTIPCPLQPGVITIKTNADEKTYYDTQNYRYFTNVILSKELVDLLKDEDGNPTYQSCTMKVYEDEKSGLTTYTWNQEQLSALLKDGAIHLNKGTNEKDRILSLELKFTCLNPTKDGEKEPTIQITGTDRIGYSEWMIVEGSIGYPEGEYPKVTQTDRAKVLTYDVQPWVEARGFKDIGEGRVEAKEMSCTIADTYGFVYRFGSGNDFNLKGTLYIDLPYEQFSAKLVTIKKEYLETMVEDTAELTIYDNQYKSTIYTLRRNEGKDMVIPVDGVRSMRLYMHDNPKERPENFSEDKEFIEVQGEAIKSGIIRSTTTIISDRYAKEYVEKVGKTRVAYGEAKLNVSELNMEIKALAHTTNTSDLVKQQDAESIDVPIDWKTHYTYELNNLSEYPIYGEGKLELNLLDNKINSIYNKPSGFHAERLYLPNDYKNYFIDGVKSGVHKVVITDTASDNPSSCEVSIEQFKKDEKGYYIEEAQWKDKGIVYPSSFALYVSGIKGNEGSTEQKGLVITLYGETDEYGDLKTTGKYTFLGKFLYEKESNIATQKVAFPTVKLSADFNDYYDRKQEEETWSNNFDKKRSYLATPYEKIVTERFSLFQDSISTAAEFKAKLTIPVLSNVEKDEEENNREFHAQKIVMKKVFFDDSYFKNGVYTFTDRNSKDFVIIVRENAEKTGVTVSKASKLGEQETVLQTIPFQQEQELILMMQDWNRWGIDTLYEIRFYGDQFEPRQKNEEGDLLITGFSDSKFEKDLWDYDVKNPTYRYSSPSIVGESYYQAKSISTGGGWYSKENGYQGYGANDITKTEADTIYRGQEGTDKERKKYKRLLDECRLLISKMFFDVQVETGVVKQEDIEKLKAGQEVKRFTNKAISYEHRRHYSIQYDDLVTGELSQYIDRLSLLSVGVDFRQYLDDAQKKVTKMENGGGHQSGYGTQEKYEHPLDGSPSFSDYFAYDQSLNADGKPYAKNYAYNTKADVDVVLDLNKMVSDAQYEVYYLKIDPRAVNGDSIQSIDIYRNDGTIENIKGNTLRPNTTKWNDTKGEKSWYRINLLYKGESNRFDTDIVYPAVNNKTEKHPYYREPNEKPDMSVAITKIIFHLKINQKEQKDGKATSPDFGSWVDDKADMEDQNMFEIVGRVNKSTFKSDFYSVPITATAQLIIGGEQEVKTGVKSKTRSTPEKPENGKKTGWSLQNYYRYHGPYYWGTALKVLPFTAADLYSYTTVRVINQRYIKGEQILDNVPENQENKRERTNYSFGSEQAYNLRIYDMMYSRNYKDTIDQLHIQTQFPPLQRDKDKKYWGFRPRKIVIKSELLKQINGIHIKDTNKQEIAVLTEGAINVQPRCDKDGNVDTALEKDYTLIRIYYKEDEQEQYNKTIYPYDIVLEEGSYLSNLESRTDDIMGDGDYASDIYGRAYEGEFFKTTKDSDLIKLYGNVNVIAGREKNDKEKDGKNNLTVYTLQHDQTLQWLVNHGWYRYVQYSTVDAIMKALMIERWLGVDLVSKSAKSYLNDYTLKENAEGTQVAVEPMNSEWGINFYNRGKKDTPIEGTNDVYDDAEITQFNFTQDLDKAYRLTKVRIPEELFAGTKENGGRAKITEFYVYDTETNKKDVLSYFKKNGSEYVLDIRKLFQDGILTRTEMNKRTDTKKEYDYPEAIDKSKIYLAEKSIKFGGTYEMVTPLLAEEQVLDEKDDLIFEGNYVDQTKEAIENQEAYDEYNSIPTFGRKIERDYNISSGGYGPHPADEEYIVKNYETRVKMQVSTSQLKSQRDELEIKSSIADNSYEYLYLFNQVSEFSYEQRRGATIDIGIKDKEGKEITKDTFAYDVDQNGTKFFTVPISSSLYAGDQVDYRLTFKVPKEKLTIKKRYYPSSTEGTYIKKIRRAIPLKNPTITFKAPKGMRILGWKLEESQYESGQVGKSQQITSEDDFIATAYKENEITGTILQGKKQYRLQDGTRTNYKTLSIQPKNHYVGEGDLYRIVVYTEVIWEEGRTMYSLPTQVIMEAEHHHNYQDYQVREKDKEKGGNRFHPDENANLRDITDKEEQKGIKATIQTALEKPVPHSSVTIKSWVSQGRKESTETGYDSRLSIEYPYKEYLDEEPVKITLKDDYMNTYHSGERVNYVMDFTKNGKPYVQLTKRPQIQTELKKIQIDQLKVSEDESEQSVLNRLGIVKEEVDGVVHYYWKAKLFYKTNLEQEEWSEFPSVYKDAKEEETFLKSIVQLRWDYQLLSPYNYQNVESQFYYLDPVELYCVAKYQEERTNLEDPQKEFVKMEINCVKTIYHDHETKDDEWFTTIRSYTMKKEKEIYRKKLKASLALQCLTPPEVQEGATKEEEQIALQSKLDTLDPMQREVKSYRPGDTYLYRITIRNLGQKKNNFTSLKEEEKNKETADVIEPVVYDKVPTEYLDVLSGVSIYIVDEQKKKDNKPDYRRALSEEEVKKVLSLPPEKVKGRDVGGAYRYESGETDTYNPKDDQEKAIEYTMYRFDFSKIGLRIKRQERLEIVYRVKIHEGGLPVAKTKDNRSVYSNTIEEKAKDLLGDHLIHEVGLTATRNNGTDPGEFLNNTQVTIDSLSRSVYARTELDHTSKALRQQASHNTKYTSENEKTWYRFSNTTAFKERKALTDTGLIFEGVTPNFVEQEERNIVWTQAEMHLLKGYLGGATELVGGADDYYFKQGKDVKQYVYGDSYKGGTEYSIVEYPYDDDKTPTIEPYENIKTRLYAINYGDYGIDGVEMTYVFPQGIRPKLEDGKVNIQLRRSEDGMSSIYDNRYGSVSMMLPVDGWHDIIPYSWDKRTWSTIDNPNIECEIVQKPEEVRKTTPSRTIVDAGRNTQADTRYEDTSCWVIKVKIAEPLSAYAGTLKKSTYMYAIDIPSYVYDVTGNDEYCDRLYVAPLDTKENSYCQIYDRREGTETLEHSNISAPYGGLTTTGHTGNKNYPSYYLNGYNVVPDRVLSDVDPLILQKENKVLQNVTTSREYAQIGNVAKRKKPFVRQWADMGTRNEKGIIQKQNFIYDEGYSKGNLTLNVNVENRYYEAEYYKQKVESNSISDKLKQKSFSYYLEDGGARGTLFDPVITVVLPYGFMPLNKEGELFSEEKNGTPTNGSNGSSDAVSWELEVKQWDRAENSQGDKQVPKEVSIDQLQAQALTKGAINVQVDFDEESKQYVLRFKPNKNEGQDMVRLLNEQLMTLKIQVVSYDLYKHGPAKGKELFQAEDIQTYVSSLLPNFEFCSDEQLDKQYHDGTSTGNRQERNGYTVLSEGKKNAGYDPRWDRVGVKLFPYDEPEKKSYPTGQRLYDETSLAQLKPIRSLLDETGTYADLNQNATASGAKKQEVVLVNTLHLFTRCAQLTNEASVSYEKTSHRVTYDTEHTMLEQPLRYSDTLWYHATLKNQVPSGVQLRKTGSIRHATYVIDTYLPKELRYEDGEDSYYVELKDEKGKTTTLTPQQAKDSGWRVIIKELPNQGKGNTKLIRALVVPAGNTSEDNQRFVGELKGNETLRVGFKMRIAEMDALDDKDSWTIQDGLEMYVSLHGLDGKTVEFETLQTDPKEKAPYDLQNIDEIEVYNRLDDTVLGKVDYPVAKEQEEMKYIADKIVGFDIIQPKYDTVRSNTVRVRRVYPKEDNGDIPTRDAVFKPIEPQELLINNVQLNKGNVQQFVVTYDLPYRSQLQMKPDRNDKSGFEGKIPITKLTTGKWEIPNGTKHYKELMEHLKVYVYVREGDEEESYQYFETTNLDSDKSEWTLVNPDGAAFDVNTELDVSQIKNKPIRQIMWVLRHDTDPIHYPVPEGTRLDIDANETLDGKQSVSDESVDPIILRTKEAIHKDEFVQNVLENSIQITVESAINTSYAKSQWLNYYVSQGAMYTDTKKIPTSISNVYRAGYEMSAEMPFLDLYLETKYLRRGANQSSWSSSLYYDLLLSRIVKHKMTLLNANDAILQKYGVIESPEEEQDTQNGEGTAPPRKTKADTATKPEIMVALPLREVAPKSKLRYIPYEESENTILDDQYQTKTSPLLLEAELPWTAYIEDLDGNKYPLKDASVVSTQGVAKQARMYLFHMITMELPLEHSEEIRANQVEPLQPKEAIKPETSSTIRLREDVQTYEKAVGESTTRSMLKFSFDGSLKPGDKLVVEFISTIGEAQKPAQPQDFQIKAYFAKAGGFTPGLLPKEAQYNTTSEEKTKNPEGFGSDHYDVNKDRDKSELIGEVAEETGEIRSTTGAATYKYVVTDFGKSNGDTDTTIPVQEGGIYTYTLSCKSQKEKDKEDVKAPVFFDILPYKGDMTIKGGKERGSKWKGFLLPESIRVWAITRNDPNKIEQVEQVVNPSEYEVYVGPIIKTETGQYQVLRNEDGSLQLPDPVIRSSSAFYADINKQGEKSRYLQQSFVKLSDLNNDKPSNYEELIREIQMLLVRFKQPENIILYGQGSYNVEYKMEAPLHTQIFAGDFGISPNAEQYKSINTAMIATTSVSSDIYSDSVEYATPETKQVSVYVNAPQDRGYIGDYVWYDTNGNAEQDEGIYDRLIDGRRQIFRTGTLDLNGDGVIDEQDDPGVDGVKVELLTENGYPANCEGEAVVKDPTSDRYYLLDETTGDYYLDGEGVRVETTQLPEVTYTTKDIYGSKGYYIFSNLKPGTYKLRFTLPKPYETSLITTKQIYDQDVMIYKQGSELPKLAVSDELKDAIAGNGSIATATTVVTAPIQIKGVDLNDETAVDAYDQEATKADLGILSSALCSGTVWNDSSASNPAHQMNGYFDTVDEESKQKEEGIPSVVIKVYEKGSKEVAVGTDGKELVTTTDETGHYTFSTLYPDKEYVLRIETLTIGNKTYQATPVQPNPNEPAKEGGDNDGVGKVDEHGTYYVETDPFKTDPMTTLAERIDIGLIAVEDGAGIIGDYVWIDRNNNGIQEEGEAPYEGMNVVLEPFYYDDTTSSWTPLTAEQMGIEEARLCATSDQNGHYALKKLPSLYEEPNTKQSYLIGYRPKADIPVGYQPTLWQQGEDKEKDSDLREDGYLVGENEYVIVAKETTNEDPTAKAVKVWKQGEEVVAYYKPNVTQARNDLDIGLLKANSGGISGQVFEDVNYDGLQQKESDRAIQGIKVYLERWVAQESYPVQGKEPVYVTTGSSIVFVSGPAIVTEQGFIQTDTVAFEKGQILGTIEEPIIQADGRYEVLKETRTNEQGQYVFDDLPMYQTNDKGEQEPIRYRIRIEKPWNAQITKKNVGEDRSIDSDIALYDKIHKPFDAITESFIFGKDHIFREHMDAGFVVTPYEVEIGDWIWNDTNQDGMQDPDEQGIKGKQIFLYRFEPEEESEVDSITASRLLGENVVEPFVGDMLLQKIGVLTGSSIAMESSTTQRVKGKWMLYRDAQNNPITTTTDEHGRYRFKVPAYDTNPQSNYFMQPYHYRVVLAYEEKEANLSPRMKKNEQGVEVPTQSKGELLTNVSNQFIEVPDVSEGTTLVLSDEFKIADVVETEKEETILTTADVIKQFLMKVMDQMLQRKEMSDAKYEVVSGSSLVILPKENKEEKPVLEVEEKEDSNDNNKGDIVDDSNSNDSEQKEEQNNANEDSTIEDSTVNGSGQEDGLDATNDNTTQSEGTLEESHDDLKVEGTEDTTEVGGSTVHSSEAELEYGEHQVLRVRRYSALRVSEVQAGELVNDMNSEAGQENDTSNTILEETQEDKTATTQPSDTGSEEEIGNSQEPSKEETTQSQPSSNTENEVEEETNQQPPVMAVQESDKTEVSYVDLHRIYSDYSVDIGLHLIKDDNEGSTDPEQPVNPEEPTDPNQPVDPEEPTDPSQPVNPEEPTDPSQPENGGNNIPNIPDDDEDSIPNDPSNGGEDNDSNKPGDGGKGDNDSNKPGDGEEGDNDSNKPGDGEEGDNDSNKPGDGEEDNQISNDPETKWKTKNRIPNNTLPNRVWDPNENGNHFGNIVKTGDMTNIFVSWLSVVASSQLLLYVLFRRKRKKTKKQ